MYTYLEGIKPSFFMDSELQQLAKTDRNPVQETRYQELLKQGGGYGQAASQSYGGGYGGDVMGSAQQFTNFGKQNIAPVVSSLKDRYKVLLDDIGQTASRELGARGVPLSSTSAQEFIQKKQQPLFVEQQAQIAGLEAGPGQEAIGQALDYSRLSQQGNQAAQDYALQRLIADRNYELALRQENRLGSSSGGGAVPSLFSGGVSTGGSYPSSPPPRTTPTGSTSSRQTTTVTPTPGFRPVTAPSQQTPTVLNNLGSLGQKTIQSISSALKGGLFGT